MYLPIAAQEMPLEISKAYCGDLQSVVVPLLADGKATPKYVGDTGKGGKLILFTSDSGEFFVVLTDVDGTHTACGILAGSDWHDADVASSPTKSSKAHPAR